LCGKFKKCGIDKEAIYGVSTGVYLNIIIRSRGFGGCVDGDLKLVGCLAVAAAKLSHV
jgi:hypothetical protein